MLIENGFIGGIIMIGGFILFEFMLIKVYEKVIVFKMIKDVLFVGSNCMI